MTRKAFQRLQEAYAALRVQACVQTIVKWRLVMPPCVIEEEREPEPRGEHGH